MNPEALFGVANFNAPVNQVNRVASVVGETSMVGRFAHEYPPP
jgi:hypothetical protein